MRVIVICHSEQEPDCSRYMTCWHWMDFDVGNNICPVINWGYGRRDRFRGSDIVFIGGNIKHIIKMVAVAGDVYIGTSPRCAAVNSA